MAEKYISKKEIINLLKPLTEYKEIEIIYLYGSAISKAKGDKIRTTTDIDGIVVVDDTQKISEKRLKEIKTKLLLIIMKAKMKKLMLHFQPIKTLSLYWHVLISGEPWILTSLKNVLIICDRTNFIKEMTSFIKRKKVYGKEEKAEKLITRAEDNLLENRELLLRSLTNLSNAATEASQIILLFDKKICLDKKKILENISKYEKEIGTEIIGNYNEIVDLEEKMKKGSLSEFSAENLDYYLEKTKIFINKIERYLGKNE